MGTTPPLHPRALPTAGSWKPPPGKKNKNNETKSPPLAACYTAKVVRRFFCCCYLFSPSLIAPCFPPLGVPIPARLAGSAADAPTLARLLLCFLFNFFSFSGTRCHSKRQFPQK